MYVYLALTGFRHGLSDGYGDFEHDCMAVVCREFRCSLSGIIENCCPLLFFPMTFYFMDVVILT